MVNDTSNFIAGFGVIPSDWSCKSANEICTKISKGTTPPKSEISNKGEIPFLRVNNLTFHGYLALDSDFIFVSKESHENFLSRSMAFPNDILMNIVGPPLGKTALLDDSYSEYNMNQAIVFYRLQKNLVDSKYFLEFLNSFKAQQWLQSRSKKTSGQQNLTIEICKELPIILPLLLEQKKIAQILSTWDQAISLTEKLLENCQQQKKALMQQLLTGKKRLLDENGVRFSEEWKTYKLKEICHLGAGVSAPQDEKYFLGGQYDFLRVSDLGSSNSRFAPPSRDKLNGTAIAELRMSPVSAGATLFTKSGASLLLNQRAQLQADTYIVSHIGFAKAIENFSRDDYLYYLFCNIDFKNLAAGTSLPALQLSVLSGYQLKIPSVAEQEKISEVLSVADKEIEVLQKKLDCLKQEKKVLMQQLLTGKKRVKVAA